MLLQNLFGECQGHVTKYRVASCIKSLVSPLNYSGFRPFVCDKRVDGMTCMSLVSHLTMKISMRLTPTSQVNCCVTLKLSLLQHKIHVGAVCGF